MPMNNHSHIDNAPFLQSIFIVPILLTMFVYLLAVIISSRRYTKKWPLYRSVFWILGVISASAAIIGPIADLAHTDFRAHMGGHLLLGMLAPLLMVLAAPMTLLLRTLHVKQARFLTRILKSWLVRILSNPIFASTLNIGGLWILYTTNLYMLMQQNMLLHILIHIHVFIAGYLFTISIIYIDPTPHRKGYIFRSFVLVLALAAHSILSKYIYAHPPIGVSTAQAEKGGQLMYYGGDAIEVVLIFIFCFQWYKNTRPRTSNTSSINEPILSTDM